MLIRYAWRNLWRNRKRTGITLGAVVLNTTILITTYGLMDGMLKRAVGYATNLVTGEAQIHGERYRKDRSIYTAVPHPEAALARADSLGIGAAPRTYVYGLVSTGTKSAGALLWGVLPGREREVFDLARHLAEGRFLGEEAGREVVLGRKLARSLHAEVGSELVCVVQAADGSLGNDLYRVVGILKSAGEGLDRSAALLHRDDLGELAVLGSRVHEIAVNSRGSRTPEEIVSLFGPLPSGTEIATWRELLPSLSDMTRLSQAALWLFGSIFFVAGALGVMNTMIMATFERFREFGILKAIGTSPWRIVGSVAAEAFLLVLLGTGAGIVLGAGIAWYLEEYGIDTTRWAETITAAGIAFDPVWRATVTWQGILFPVLALQASCLLAALYPAAIAARLDPVRAIEKRPR
ncbi:MAG: FtsX-like permease family protein [Candidatus Eisenbacteria bacterium]